MIGLRACAGLILLVSTVPLAAQDSASQQAQTTSDQPQPKIDLPKSKVLIFSDTEGVDFSEWLELWHSETAKTWRPLIPEEVSPPELKKGVVYIRFKVLPNGQVIDMTLDGRSGDANLTTLRGEQSPAPAILCCRASSMDRISNCARASFTT